MKKLKFKLNKKFIDKIRDETNLILYNINGIGIQEMQLVNNILRGLENVKFQVCYN